MRSQYYLRCFLREQSDLNWDNPQVEAAIAARSAWPTWVLSNHDVPRHRQRYGGGELEARMATIMLLTLPGTPFMYQGEELGQDDAHLLAWARSDGGAMEEAIIMLCTDSMLEGSIVTGGLPARVAFVARRDGTM